MFTLLNYKPYVTTPFVINSLTDISLFQTSILNICTGIKLQSFDYFRMAKHFKRPSNVGTRALKVTELIKTFDQLHQCLYSKRLTFLQIALLPVVEFNCSVEYRFN